MMEITNRQEKLEVRGCAMAGSVFDDVNLANAGFSNVNAEGARFDDVRLANGSFRNVDLSNVDIRDARLNGMRINGMLVTDLIAAYGNEEAQG